MKEMNLIFDGGKDIIDKVKHSLLYNDGKINVFIPEFYRDSKRVNIQNIPEVSKTMVDLEFLDKKQCVMLKHFRSDVLSYDEVEERYGPFVNIIGQNEIAETEIEVETHSDSVSVRWGAEIVYQIYGAFYPSIVKLHEMIRRGESVMVPNTLSAAQSIINRTKKNQKNLITPALSIEVPNFPNLNFKEIIGLRETKEFEKIRERVSIFSEITSKKEFAEIRHFQEDISQEINDLVKHYHHTH